MAFPKPPGLSPAEVAFLCEMEQVTIVPRQRLERLDLLGGTTRPLMPPQKTTLPLWLAILLKRQRRANIVPPPWLYPEALEEILELETEHFPDSFSLPPVIPPARQTDFMGKSFYASPPFVESCTASAVPNALPYHWYELSEMLLNAASDDVSEPDRVRQLLRDVREVRLAKMRKEVEHLSGDGEGTRLDGLGAMELSESRGFLTGVIDGLRKIDASREQARREREEEERERRGYNDDEYDEEDDEMT
ncbi:DNA replication protein psf2 [Exophiala dermatitidis]|uniref:DNA replication complex GINS protein PSF2 n=2 Tax=Exophiala dermatitidis TaxID=5970 RepID=H6BMA8_EXODN|nr:GINS complex subunit 2 [Exophiala dermatitidis NIH/UT8656]KAJ4512205.1 DNA replication protein psf2 [Exophiala dermatitidis]EHY52989.1 GINS complex subunit 2 [Exophiala dermatitidis NIH/UT8656]KAJ4515108.1 DNA replication protein psf2 [Exophiala dermatitidis]KAJ4552639.1 DNA replication protein psf2 [Exophiala dermatitidis]KAJ4567140.1 DNA replication protein psf2 [Exophiala dermatitidis]